ncbi:N-acetylmuramoyl-L-alanine amidase-like domain-containing protein [Indibacter alkaliphilus]|uniref:N-acetylmuramoyl-L-alanine amidase-like domain-containing protein n=1 Tax=Indibacter alkaliphilus TaxID=579922 RepID=UPI001F426AF1|nr:N-acetylmuramoyl-L-alanine amidase-like domain-containing protein [Indibacter alkaliphilus]
MRLFFLFFSLLPCFLQAQTVCTLESRERLEGILEDLSVLDMQDKSINDLNVIIGQMFLGTPYVEKTLELPGEEKLVINLTGLDCTTYLETVFSLSRLAQSGRLTIEDFEKELEKIRYQKGKREGYPSRLHYFSDWIYQNQEKDLIHNITKEIGGKPYENRPTFMSSNPNLYAQLANDAYVEELKKAEQRIGQRNYYFVPKEELKNLEHNIKPGDMIAITTTMKNLDIVHVGFAVEKNGRIHLMHASTGSMKVEISEKPLQDYLMTNKSQSGIMVSRPLSAKP